MPLRMKCTSCGKDLSLDPVFAGASCKCPRCRNVLHVPRAGQEAAARPTQRPAMPPLAAAAPTRIKFRASAPAQRSGSQAAKPTRWSSASYLPRTLTAKLLTGGVAACLFIGVGLTVWLWTGEGRSEPPTIVAMTPPVVATPVEPSPPALWDPKTAILESDPKTSYFGLPVEGKTIGLIVDNDRTMAPFIDRLAAVTNSLTRSEHLQGRRFGIVRPANRDRSNIVEVAEPSGDLEGARSVLVSRVPTGDTDLPRALLTTRGWYADQLFLVLSKPVDDAQMALLTQAAEQSGAITHVVALGQAAEQDLSPIAAATGGRFIPVTDDLLDDLVRRSE